jgi:ATP-binding cassette subfamily F protein 3
MIVNDISVWILAEPLFFSDVHSFAINNENDKIALMGKMEQSTLLKIIAGQNKPSTGNISAPKGLW